MPHSDKHTEIAVIGAGFSGLMTAVHLMRKASSPLTLHLINNKYPFGKGAAYSTSTLKHLLNVPAAKMSAMDDDPNHFLNWAHRQPAYNGINKDVLGRTFMPRILYGKYLAEIWEEALKNKRTDTDINLIEDMAVDMTFEGKYNIYFKSHTPVSAQFVVLATGNEAPCNPAIPNEGFYDSPAYVKRPWSTDITKLLKPGQDVMIIGNGMTMVDIVISIMETGYKGKIHTLSPRGFSVLPHRFNYIDYPDFVNELKEPYRLDDLFTKGHRYFHLLHKAGISAEPLVDSLRPITQRIWQSFTIAEKETFLREIRPMWNKVRHRLAPHHFDYMQNLRIKGQLIVHKGSLVNIEEGPDGITAHYLSRHTQTEKTAQVGLVINCTGPHIDISRTENPLLRSLLDKGMIKPDPLHISMDATERWTLLDAQNAENPSLYTIGPNLRGLLWETTAVPEIREQAAKLAADILDAAKV